PLALPGCVPREPKLVAVGGPDRFVVTVAQDAGLLLGLGGIADARGDFALGVEPVGGQPGQRSGRELGAIVIGPSRHRPTVVDRQGSMLARVQLAPPSEVTTRPSGAGVSPR